VSDSSPIDAAGDRDIWMLLSRQSEDGYPLVVRTRCNPEVTQFSEVNKVVAVICDVRDDLVNDNGMPSCFEELIDIEDALVAAVAASGKIGYHTASVTGDGRRVFYFAIEPTLPIAELTEEQVVRVGELSLMSDFEFDTYVDFITPTDLDRQLDGDRKVVQNLSEGGDDGQIPRTIEFWFYGERSALQSVADRLTPAGFQHVRWLDETDGVVLSLESAVGMDTFRDLTPLLVNTAAEFGVTYDGWETPVISPQAPPPQAKPSLFGKLFGQRKH
jgi:hypothetical protein